MAEIDDNRKRSLPEPVTEAMIIRDYLGYQLKRGYFELVQAQLRAMREKEDADTEKIDKALKLTDFLLAWMENHHTVGGIEDIKQKFIEESGSTREAISKAGIIKEMGVNDVPPT